MAYWVKFKNNEHPAGCVAGYNEGIRTPADAMAKAKQVTGKDPISAHVLPYGGHPVIYASKESRHGFFCTTPETCCGRTSCPKNYACSE